jgi:hypothetical protein
MRSADRSLVPRIFAGAIAVGLAILAGTGCGKHPGGKVENSRYTALGEVMAGKLNELAGSQGSIVLVVGESDHNQPTPIGQAITAFRNALGKSVQISATETVTMPAVLPPGFEPLPADKFAGLLQKHGGADYLVSFVGVPVLTPAQIGQLPSRRPQTVEVVTFRAPSKAMFANKVVCLAALSRQVLEQGATGGAAQEIFDSHYQLVSRENAGALPY